MARATPVREFPWAWVWVALVCAAAAGSATTVVVWGATPVAHSDAIDAGIKVAAGVLAVLAAVVTVHRLRLGQAQQRVREAEQRLQEADQRQREIEHAHRIDVDDEARRDAAERRVTELLLNAGNLLANENATTRITGLVSLERLGQGNPSYRQTVIDVICAYLQMPFEPPPLKERIPVYSTGPAVDDRETGRGEPARQELRVRLTAQRILATHLRRSAPEDGFWPDMAVALPGATLVHFSMSRCELSDADFTDAVLVGLTHFAETRFTGVALFTGARFTGPADFEGASFRGDAFLDAVTFTGYQGASAVTFAKTSFRSGAWFTGTDFHGLADFDSAVFHRGTTLAGASFHDQVALSDAYVSYERESLPAGWRTDDRRSGPHNLYAVVRDRA